jgi:hypothetical protein
MSETVDEMFAGKRAIRTVAHYAIYMATRGESDGCAVAWENYPEIGENDWQDVLDVIDALAKNPSGFDAAYALLTARAEHI